MSVSDPGGWADVKGANTWLAGVQISRWINTTWGCGLGWLSSGCGFEKERRVGNFGNLGLFGGLTLWQVWEG